MYSALGSFYIPSCIMVFVYIRIYYAAKARARRGIRKQPRKPPNEQVSENCFFWFSSSVCHTRKQLTGRRTSVFRRPKGFEFYIFDVLDLVEDDCEGSSEFLSLSLATL